MCIKSHKKLDYTHISSLNLDYLRFQSLFFSLLLVTIHSLVDFDKFKQNRISKTQKFYEKILNDVHVNFIFHKVQYRIEVIGSRYIVIVSNIFYDDFIYEIKRIHFSNLVLHFL